MECGFVDPLVLFSWPPELWDIKFLLFYATRPVVISYSTHRKLKYLVRETSGDDTVPEDRRELWCLLYAKNFESGTWVVSVRHITPDLFRLACKSNGGHAGQSLPRDFLNPAWLTIRKSIISMQASRSGPSVREDTCNTWRILAIYTKSVDTHRSICLSSPSWPFPLLHLLSSFSFQKSLFWCLSLPQRMILLRPFHWVPIPSCWGAWGPFS